MCVFRIACAVALLAGAGRAAAQAEEGEAATVVKPAAKARTIQLKMRDGLRFEPSRVEAKPGEELVFVIENRDVTDMVHNFLVLRPGTREAVVGAAMALGERGPAQDYIPASGDVLAHTQLLKPDAESRLSFRVPETAGIYPYVCTFPGHGILMYGALYAGVPMPPIDKDPDVPASAVQAIVPGGNRRPFVQRIFMPNAGPAAIAVALPGGQNLCWDAGECRLRYAWQGAFIDASDHWSGNGDQLPVLPAPPWWRAQAGDTPLRFGDANSPAPAVKFLGYETTPDGPRFLYRAGDNEVAESPRRGKSGGLEIHYRISGAKRAVFFRGEPDGEAKWTSAVGNWQNGILSLPAADVVEFTVTLSSPLCQP